MKDDIFELKYPTCKQNITKININQQQQDENSQYNIKQSVRSCFYTH